MNPDDISKKVEGYLASPLTRRALLKRAGGAVGVVSLASLLAACGGSDDSAAPTVAETQTPTGGGETAPPSTEEAPPVAGVDPANVGGELAYLGWQGYEDASVVGPWLEDNGVTLKTSYIAANDDVITKLSAGGVGQFDVATPFIAYVPALVELDLIQPIPIDGLSNYPSLFPQFQSPEVKGIEAPDGSVYTVPLIWGAFTMLYDPEALPQPPGSWLDLLKPEFKGKVIMYDDPYSQILVWAKALGLIENDANLTRAELDQVRDSLIELKKNARTIVPNYGEMTDLFARGEGTVATSGWDAVISFAADKGKTIASTIPSEGTFSWTDTYVLVKDAPNRDTAVAFIDEVISVEAQVGFAPFLVSGIVNQDAVAELDPKVAALYPYDEIDTYFSKAPIASVPPLEANGEDVMTLQDWQAAWAEVKQA